MGLMRAARRAGSQQAISAIAMSRSVVPMKTRGLSKRIPGLKVARKRASPMAPTSPMPDHEGKLHAGVRRCRMSTMPAPIANGANSPVRCAIVRAMTA